MAVPKTDIRFCKTTLDDLHLLCEWQLREHVIALDTSKTNVEFTV